LLIIGGEYHPIGGSLLKQGCIHIISYYLAEFIDSQSRKILSSYGHVGMIPHTKAIINLKLLKCFLGVGSPIEP
jgi:hypothetical protein